jgi:hypothetical protein
MVGEFEDNALLNTFGRRGLGLFFAPAALAQRHGRAVQRGAGGPVPQVREQFYRDLERPTRKIQHPAVEAILPRMQCSSCPAFPASAPGRALNEYSVCARYNARRIGSLPFINSCRQLTMENRRRFLRYSFKSFWQNLMLVVLPLPGRAERLLRGGRIRHRHAAQDARARHRQNLRPARAASSPRCTASSTPTCRPASSASRSPRWAWAGSANRPSPACSNRCSPAGRRDLAADHPRRLLRVRLQRHFLPAHRGRRTGAEVAGDPHPGSGRPVVRAAAVRFLLGHVPGDLAAERQRQMVLRWPAWPAPAATTPITRPTN